MGNLIFMSRFEGVAHAVYCHSGLDPESSIVILSEAKNLIAKRFNPRVTSPE
jgi:hypothetical protein